MLPYLKYDQQYAPGTPVTQTPRQFQHNMQQQQPPNLIQPSYTHMNTYQQHTAMQQPNNYIAPTPFHQQQQPTPARPHTASEYQVLSPTHSSGAGNGKLKVPVELVEPLGKRQVELVVSVATKGSDHARFIEIRIDNPMNPAFLFSAQVTFLMFKQLTDSRDLNGHGTFDTMASDLERHLHKVLAGELVAQFHVANDTGRLQLIAGTTVGPWAMWTIPFKQANDTEVKIFALEAWTVQKEKSDRLEEQLSQKGAVVRELTAKVDQLQHQLQELTSHQESVLAAERVKSDRDLVDQEKHFAQEISTLKKSHEEAIAKQEVYHSTKWLELNAMHETLQQQHNSLQKEKSVCESEKNTLGNKVASLTSENEHLKNEVQTLRRDFHQTDDLYKQQTRELTQLQRKSDQLESACVANEKILSRVQEGESKEQAVRQSLEEVIGTLRRDLSHLTEKHNLTLGEFAKGQDVLTRLQTRLRELKGQYERKKEEIATLRKTIETMEREAGESSNVTSHLRRDISTLEGEKIRLEGELAKSIKQTKDVEAELAKTQRMFEALSAEKTTQQIGGLSSIQSGPSYQPIGFTSSLHTSMFQPTPSYSYPSLSHVAPPTMTTPMQPSLPQRAPGTLDFDSPSPGAVPINKSQLASTQGTRFESNVNEIKGISATARQYLSQRGTAPQNTSTFILPTTRTVSMNKENAPTMHNEILFSPIQTNSTQAHNTSTRQPLASINPRSNNINQQTNPSLYNKVDPLANYAPNVNAVNVH